MRVIKHGRLCRATGTLVVPAWKSAPYWPVLCPDGTHFADFIHHWEKVHFYPQLLRDGRSGNNIGNAMNTETLILVLFIDLPGHVGILNLVFVFIMNVYSVALYGLLECSVC